MEQNSFINKLYPVRPDTDQWQSLPNKASKFEACQLTDDILREMPTKELLSVVLAYPMLEDIYFYTPYVRGLDYLTENFNGLQEFIKRKDAGEETMALYAQAQPEIADSSVDASSYKKILEFTSIEVLLAYKPIFETCDREALSKLVSQKYNQDNHVYAEGKRGKSNNFYVQLSAQQLSLDSSFFQESPVIVYLPTPKGNKVEAWMRGELLTPYEKAARDSYAITTYKQATFISGSTTLYNCHSFAWYTQQYSRNNLWINNPSLYMSDGSYNNINFTALADQDKVYYHKTGNAHSGIYVYRSSSIVPLIMSKWGDGPLMRHPLDDCPYDSTFVRYYHIAR